ncbi:hypothetical protein TorRG33x02_286480 [Trema orientale]|uniref:Uncharacterized protein n=1 Tax=Trema orientale TaxID=63057 RepID=A0A2P5CG30_TREOI|nr:hypothetical protein TorRG33x02_286480 [Trema orientale]
MAMIIPLIYSPIFSGVCQTRSRPPTQWRARNSSCCSTDSATRGFRPTTRPCRMDSPQLDADRVRLNREIKIVRRKQIYRIQLLV